MLLPVNSISKTTLCLYVGAALGVGTALYYLFREKTTPETNAPSLANRDVSFLRSIPGISWVMNYFSPTEEIKSSEEIELPVDTIGSTDDSPAVMTIGNPSTRVTSQKQLIEQLDRMQGEKNGVLVIYGKNLEINDKNILGFNPVKLILVDTSIAESKDVNSLEQYMIKNGWVASSQRLSICSVRSVDQALNFKTKTDIETQEPIRIVYSLKT
jgi:hypothetical protein